MFESAYKAVMDPEVNGLSGLPKIVRFQLMSILALMWSVVFCVWSGAIALIGPSMAAHSILLIGIFFTADVLRVSRRSNVADHRRLYRDETDGCARYDDLWGG